MRPELEAGAAEVKVETDSTAAREMTMQIELLPENFQGDAYTLEKAWAMPAGAGVFSVQVPMPTAKRWWPESPFLYRARILLKDGTTIVDAKDALFGFRSFALPSSADRDPTDLAAGTFLLNGRPVYLRGTNVSGALNLWWYWQREDDLLSAMLMLKAAHVNAVRATQHVMFPEVRELLDRLGIMSEQDQGGGNNTAGDLTQAPSTDPQNPHAIDNLAATAPVLARATYNNPGVVLLSYANETWFDPKPIIDNVLRVDPDRVLVPISGTDITDEPDRHHYETFPAFSDAYWNHVVYDIHRYPGWYWFSGEIWQLNRRYPAGHMITIGEFGAEALDSYATMLTYPANFAPTPPADSDVLWGAIQTQKADRRQIIGFRGNTPTNLAEYIQASQTYQADVLGEQLTGLRLSPRRIGGYFLFHFIDGVPVHWPKSIVSFDRRPKLSYYTFAQLNQPAVPLFVIADNGQSMQIWVGNDTDQGVRGATVSWTVTEGERTILQGQATADIPPVGTVAVERNVDLTPIDQGTDVVTVSLWLADACGQTISELRREVFLKAWRLQDGLFTPDFPTRQQWTMDGTGIGHQTGAAEADGTWSATVASHTAGYLQFGPYVSNVSAGTHKAMYRLQVDNVTADSGPIVRLEVSNFTQHIMLAQRDVTRDEWAAAQRYQTFELPFEMPADDSMRNDKIELRVFWYRRAYVREALVGYR